MGAASTIISRSCMPAVFFCDNQTASSQKRTSATFMLERMAIGGIHSLQSSYNEACVCVCFFFYGLRRGHDVFSGSPFDNNYPWMFNGTFCSLNSAAIMSIKHLLLRSPLIRSVEREWSAAICTQRTFKATENVPPYCSARVNAKWSQDARTAPTSPPQLSTRYKTGCAID